MTKKNYNSIVFLTTLSVYLGLVLAGGAGAPQVLAQAALTRNFDVNIEAEVKDDLDNKPGEENDSSCDGLKAQATDEQDNKFVGQYVRFVSELARRSYSQNYEMSAALYSLSVTDVEFFESIFPSLRKDLEVDEFNYELTKETLSTKLILKPKSTGKNVSFAPASAAYPASLNYRLCQSTDKYEAVILKHTEISAENNQVFIVTRLPRGSIDSLLVQQKNAN